MKHLLNICNINGPAVPGKLQHGRIEMADITMCTQTLCPNWKHCYRAQAKPRSWQSMATFDYTISVRGVECDNYMPTPRPAGKATKKKEET